LSSAGISSGDRFVALLGNAVVWLLEALCYKPEGSSPDEVIEFIISLLILSSRTIPMGFTQPLT
jgi:hypothetical protein